MVRWIRCYQYWNTKPPTHCFTKIMCALWEKKPRNCLRSLSTNIRNSRRRYFSSYSEKNTNSAKPFNNLKLFVTHLGKTGHLSLTKQKCYIPYLKEQFVSWKMIPLICKLNEALLFYGQKFTSISFYFLCLFPNFWTNILKNIHPTSALFWCDGSHFIPHQYQKMNRTLRMQRFHLTGNLKWHVDPLHCQLTKFKS